MKYSKLKIKIFLIAASMILLALGAVVLAIVAMVYDGMLGLLIAIPIIALLVVKIDADLEFNQDLLEIYKEFDLYIEKQEQEKLERELFERDE